MASGHFRDGQFTTIYSLLAEPFVQSFSINPVLAEGLCPHLTIFVNPGPCAKIGVGEILLQSDLDVGGVHVDIRRRGDPCMRPASVRRMLHLGSYP